PLARALHARRAPRPRLARLPAQAAEARDRGARALQPALSARGTPPSPRRQLPPQEPRGRHQRLSDYALRGRPGERRLGSRSARAHRRGLQRNARRRARLARTRRSRRALHAPFSQWKAPPVKRHDLAAVRAHAPKSHELPHVTPPDRTAPTSVPSERPRSSGRAEVTAAVLEAQKLAFAPIAFAVAKAVRDLGVLAAIKSGGRSGRSIADIAAATDLDEPALKMMVEASLSFGLVQHAERGYAITKVGHFV